ncbi:MAG: ATP-binding protein [Akkermansiaceae bacterium]|nr:ATP-binding protein [Akkermansiaceae bacterium]
MSALPNAPAIPPEPVRRNAMEAARERLSGFPVLTITGPRQSGKTTLSRMLLPDVPYFSLEDPDIRAFATEDPRGFLRQVEDGAILDEVQRAPALFSYLQGVVDAERRMGRFILTGSSQFELIESITQSLAGRSAMLTLLPFTLGELQAAGRAPETVDQLLYAGFFPPIHDRPVEPSIWLQDYIGTYLERDVRQILNIQDLATFQRFVQLCAGRTGQLVNVSSLAADAGITRVTAGSWLSVLQTSHLVFLVQPWFTNLSKRLIKTPKLYFCDPGLAAWLLGVRKPEHLTAHPQRGALFENWVMTELLKAQTNRGLKPSLHFLRDKQGREVDALVESGPTQIEAIEIKSGETIASDFFDGLNYWRENLPGRDIITWLIYGGTNRQSRSQAAVLPWNDLSPVLSKLSAG